MKLPEVKNFFSKAAKTTVLFTVLVSSMTGCSFQFTRANPEDIVSESAVEDLVSNIYEDLDATDWSNPDSVNQTAQIIVDNASKTAENEEALSEFQKASIVKVIDGDTIVVNIENDKDSTKEYTVRLIGINTPESVASEEYLEKTGKENTEAGKSASEYTKLLLDNVDYVYLQTDTSDTDQYGRLLRYVWLDIPTDQYNLSEIANNMLNGILVKEHIAEVATYYPDIKYEDNFTEIYEQDVYER